MALHKTDHSVRATRLQILAFLISLTTSRALTFSPLFLRTHFSEEGRSCRSAHSLFGNVVKELLLQHPIDVLPFSFLDLDWVEQISLLIVLYSSSCHSCASNSGKSAVGPAVHRQPAASRALSTLLSQVSVSTSVPRLSRSAQPTALDDFLQHASSCSLPFSFVHARFPVHVDRLSQSCASDTLPQTYPVIADALDVRARDGSPCSTVSCTL